MSIRRKRGANGNLEMDWEKPRGRQPQPWMLWVVFAALGVLAVTGVILFPAQRGDGAKEMALVRQVEAPEKELRDELDSAEAVARAFLAEGDPQARLKWVRDAEGVRGRLREYSEEARTAPGEIDKVIGHGSADGRQVTAFAVEMPSGGMRLLEVVGTPEGSRVDWDAYARHGTAAWEDLWSGKAERATVRVFCEPSTERPAPFDDRKPPSDRHLIAVDAAARI